MQNLYQTAVYTVDAFVDADNAAALLSEYTPDYVLDAIDHVPGKVALIQAATAQGIPIVVCMGTGNKLFPEKFQITDITKTHTCALARAMRRRLREVYRLHEEQFKPGWDLVVVARSRCIQASFDKLTAAYLALAQKAGVLKEEA